MSSAPDTRFAAFRGSHVMITGGVGLIGSALARRLAALGAEVLLVDSMVPEAGGNLANIADISERVQLAIADIRDTAALRRLLAGQDFLLDLAGQTSHLDSMNAPEHDLAVNCTAQLQMLELCRELDGAAFEVWGGEQRRDLLYVEDAVEAFLSAALTRETAGLALNVGGGEPYTLLALAEALIRANGGGRFEHREFPAERKAIDIGDFVTDDSRFRELTGWAPRVGLDDGLARSLDYYRRHLPDYI